MTNWLTYVSHKEVQAAKIVGFFPFDHCEAENRTAALVDVGDGGNREEFVPNHMVMLAAADLGDWAIKYADGHKSISPANAFEEGYTPKYLPDEAEATKVSQAAQQVAPNQAATPERTRHVWGPSRIGHGESQCRHCLMTNREAVILMQVEFCPL